MLISCGTPESPDLAESGGVESAVSDQAQESGDSWDGTVKVFSAPT
jgi:hypothetical protein